MQTAKNVCRMQIAKLQALQDVIKQTTVIFVRMQTIVITSIQHMIVIKESVNSPAILRTAQLNTQQFPKLTSTVPTTNVVSEFF